MENQRCITLCIRFREIVMKNFYLLSGITIPFSQIPQRESEGLEC